MQYDRFGEEVNVEEEEINGIRKREMELFIENNHERYINVFKKNENKKFFLNMNLAAFFVTFYWIFYRRMFKVGFVYLLCLFIFSTLMYTASLIYFKDDIEAIADLQFNSDTYTLEDEIIVLQMQNNLKSKTMFFDFFTHFIFTLFFGLIADCLYRNHILRKIKYSEGGVSTIAILGATGIFLCYSLITIEINFIIERIIIG